MLTLIVNGSPRPQGDTASLLGRLLERLDGEALVVNAYRPDISPCVDCRTCWREDRCAQEDGMRESYEALRQADNVLIASPIYFSELPGRVLDWGSRLQRFYCAKAFRGEEPFPQGKRGAALLVGGGDGSPDTAYRTARILLRHAGCVELCPLAASLGTNTRPALEDPEALAGVERIARFFNREDRP